jgi:hypothetical protein
VVAEAKMVRPHRCRFAYCIGLIDPHKGRKWTEVRRGGIEPPPALQLGSESLGLSADSRMGGDSATRLRSNAAPHHTLYFLIELIIISTPIIAETLSTPPIEAATDAITVTLAPKLQATGSFVQHNIRRIDAKCPEVKGDL